MTAPINIRAVVKGDVAEIRVAISHAMETGQRKDKAGNAIPAHFIQTLDIDVGDKRVIEGQTGTSISRNPVFTFKVKGAKAGDKVVVNWVDSKGDKRLDEATVEAGS